MKRLFQTLVVILAAPLFVSACGNGKSLPGIDSFHVGVTNSNLIAGFRATFLKWNQGITAPIPGVSGGTISVLPDLGSGGSVFQLTLPVQALSSSLGIFPFPNAGLPDGRPLPGVLSGEMPKWDLVLDPVQKFQVSFYLSDEAFGVFIPLGLSVAAGVLLSLPVEDERGNRLGRVYAIGPAKAGAAGAGIWFLVSR